MSLRYTGDGTMDEPALRDVERWKDKIEVRLDNRQVFFLFFGSAMVACMLFVLGVIVGKRLETRGRAEAPAIEDPLAVLDRFGVAMAPAQPPTALTFPRALTGGGASGLGPSKTKATSTATLASTAPIATVTAPVPVAVAVPVAASSKQVSAVPVGASSKQASAVPRVLPSAIPVVRVTASQNAGTAGPVSVAPRGPAAPRATVKEPTQLVKVALAGIPKTAAASADKSKGRFLLQLSSFQDRGDADAFARRFTGQGAHVVATEIPGKGTWYRVRVGSYGSMQEATLAKTTFERDHNVIAYVAGSGPAR